MSVESELNHCQYNGNAWFQKDTQREEEREKEGGEELAGKSHRFKFLAEIWSSWHLCRAVATRSYCRSFQAWLENTHTSVPTHVSPACEEMSDLECVCLPWLPWMVVIELKSLSQYYLTPPVRSGSQLNGRLLLACLIVLTTWGIHCCQRHVWLSAPCTCVCVCMWWKHLTPVIIAFRLVTGRISIHSGGDLFSGEACREMFSQNWWHQEVYIHSYIQLSICWDAL